MPTSPPTSSTSSSSAGKSPPTSRQPVFPIAFRKAHSASSEETVVEPEDENGQPVQALLGKASNSHKPGRRSVVVLPAPAASSPPRSRSHLVFITSSSNSESALDEEDDGEHEQEYNDDTGPEREQQEPERRQQHRLAIPHSIFRRLSTTSHMSLPRSNYDPRRVCLNPFPEFTLGKHKRTIGVYVAGALFAIANWAFLDAAILSAHAKSPWGQPGTDDPPVHVTFVDWIPGICSLLGYFVINMIDKDRIRGDEGFGDSRAVWRARLFLFIGFALMAGGLAGSVTVLVLKYILGSYPEQFTYYGYANVSQSVAMMLSAVVLWIAQNTSSEYEYNLTL
ncbi:hypothetical protein EST38_g7299 [Candolleomyces aberdarensis]|uniref:Uncharacterized protein n=1 Tax=Candolleomyces aberdarensis TaxID=2316362 RepID=A0A4Q2DHP8_9AGAR|nr:hypothetical protein EST38_g7299 [Candolleomyces aberdarensis]